jgi:hypothetical protein
LDEHTYNSTGNSKVLKIKNLPCQEVLNYNKDNTFIRSLSHP